VQDLDSRETPAVTIRDAIKTYQRRLVELDDSHSRAKDRLDSARSRRTELVKQQDQAVAEAEKQVEVTVVDMAAEVGADLTGSLLGIEASHVRRLLKRHLPQGSSSGGRSLGGPRSSRSGERTDEGLRRPPAH
jgi:hypothetical protein